MPSDSVSLDQFNKVPRLVEGQRRFGEVRIGGEKVGWPAMQIREIAPPAAGDEDFASGLAVVFEEGNPPAALASDGCAHQASRAGPQNNHIEFAWSGGHIV